MQNFQTGLSSQVAALSLHWEHWLGQGPMAPLPLRFNLLANEECVKINGSWLRSRWKALAPLWASVRMRPRSTTHTHTHSCSRPPLLTNSSSQPRRSQARKRRRRRKKRGRATWTRSSRRSSGRHVNRASVFIHPGSSTLKEEPFRAIAPCRWTSRC